jgi:putative FmdB family regulatory protein
MPIFEYICQQCDHEFEALVFGEQQAECPKCHGKKLSPQLSTFADQAPAAAADSTELASEE